MNVTFHELEKEDNGTGYTEYLTKMYISFEILQFRFKSLNEESEFIFKLNTELNFNETGFNEYYRKSKNGTGILVRKENDIYKVYLVKYNEKIRSVKVNALIYFNVSKDKFIEKIKKNAIKILYDERTLAEISKKTKIEMITKNKTVLNLETPIYLLVKRADRINNLGFSYNLNVLYSLDDITK